MKNSLRRELTVHALAGNRYVKVCRHCGSTEWVWDWDSMQREHRLYWCFTCDGPTHVDTVDALLGG